MLEDVEDFLLDVVVCLCACVGVRVDACLCVCLGELAGEDAAELDSIKSEIVMLRGCAVSFGGWVGEFSGVLNSC